VKPTSYKTQCSGSIFLTDDPVTYEESINFWRSHALVHDLAVMDEPFESTWEKVL